MQESRTIEDAPAGRRSSSMYLTHAGNGDLEEIAAKEIPVPTFWTILKKIEDVNLPGGEPLVIGVVEIPTAHMELAGQDHPFQIGAVGALPGILMRKEGLSNPVEELLLQESMINPCVEILRMGIALAGRNAIFGTRALVDISSKDDAI